MHLSGGRRHYGGACASTASTSRFPSASALAALAARLVLAPLADSTTATATAALPARPVLAPLADSITATATAALAAITAVGGCVAWPCGLCFGLAEESC